MLLILAIWQVSTAQNWVGPTMAIALVIIALSFVAVAVALVLVLSLLVRQEAGAFAHAGRRLRRQVVKGADRIQSKLEDLETLYDVVHEEVEDTALDVAAVLRSVRQGNGVLGRIRRLLVSRRR